MEVRKQKLTDKGKVSKLKHQALIKKAAQGIKLASVEDQLLYQQQETLVSKQPDYKMQLDIPLEPVNTDIWPEENSMIEEEQRETIAATNLNTTLEVVSDDLNDIDIFEEDIVYSQFSKQRLEAKKTVLSKIYLTKETRR